MTNIVACAPGEYSADLWWLVGIGWDCLEVTGVRTISWTPVTANRR